MVPDVPREILQAPSPTVPVPTAAAALSPAPAAMTVVSGTPSFFAISGRMVPTFSYDSKIFAICDSRTPQISSISLLQHLFFTSNRSIPEASETSVQCTPDST